ncbi:MAG: phosphotransferase [Planctomycetota bacterium]
MDELLQRVADALGVPVEAVRPLGGGACQDLFRVELSDGRALVLRSDAARSLPGSLERAREFEVARAAAAAGVRTPAPSHLSADLVREGAGAYLLPLVAGEALGARVVRHESLAAAREVQPPELGREQRAIHALRPGADEGLDRALGAPPADPAAAALAELERMLALLPAPRPALELALRWLAAHRPEPAAPALVHGDFRVGNLLVGPQGLSAVLDWEFAHWGDPAEDLAWFCVRDWRFGREELAAGGVATREALLAAYAAAGGQAPDAARMHFWEVFGDARWAAGAHYQAERYRAGAQQDLELLAVGWRAEELELEALRQLDQPLTGSLGAAPRGARPAPGPVAPAELLAGLLRFLEQDLGPALARERGLAFRARIAGSLLQSLALFERGAGQLAREQAARLAPLVGQPGSQPDDPPEALERELCRRLREDPPDPAEEARWRAAVREGLAARVALKNPRFDLRGELP